MLKHLLQAWLKVFICHIVLWLCINVQTKEILPTFGRDAREPELCVVMVSTVVMPKATLAGAASILIQNDTQERMTIKRLGMYIWMR